MKKTLKKSNEDEFDYYKRHILLENYDEEPEDPGVLSGIIEQKMKEEGVVKGFTKWFDDVGNQSWQECEIVSYDEKEKLFKILRHSPKEVKICNNNKEEKKIVISTVEKKVTRFNCLLKGESLDNLNRRVKLAEKWKFYAQKYMALYHFVDESKVLNPYNFVTDDYMNKLLSLCFLYRGKNKHQSTPIELENMDNSERFGIWRRYAFRRVIDSNPKKLQKILKTYSRKSIANFMEEIKQLNERSYQLHQFYKNLPLNYHYYQLLNDIIPLKKFLTPTERFLLPEKEKGTIQFKKKNEFLEMYTKMQYKLHQNEADLSKLYEIVITQQEKSMNTLLFYQNFLTKPVTLETFKHKNSNQMSDFFKIINAIISNAKSEMVKYLKERKEEAEKVNKEAGIPEHLKHKFRKFRNLLNRTISTYTRETFHRSMKYMTEQFDKINNKIKEEHNCNFENFIKYNKILKEKLKNKRKKEDEEKEKEDKKDKKEKKEEIKEEEAPIEEHDEDTIAQEEEELKKITMNDLLKIRDDYPLEQIFAKDFSLLQFSFELKCENKNFSLDPDFKKFWTSIEKHIRNSLNEFKTIQGVFITDLLNKEEQAQYIRNENAYLTIFYEDDQSYESEIETLKKSFELFFAPAEVMLRILNKEIMPHLLELMKFASGKNLDEESLDVKVFRHFINENKKYFDFFSNMFKYDYFFLGGINISVHQAKEIWLKRLSETKEKLTKLVISNNKSLSGQMEKEAKEIAEKLETVPNTVDEYDEMVKYCHDFNIKIKGIWEKIHSQQENAELLEENFISMVYDDIRKMWACYGFPKYLNYKKEETVARLEADRKVFKKKVKQRYKDTIEEISKMRQDFETNTLISEIDTYEETFKFFSSQKYDIEKMIKNCRILNDHEAILRMKTSDLTEIREIKQNFDPYYDLWESVFNFEAGKKSWMEDTLKSIDRKKLKLTYEKCVNTIDHLEKTIFRKDKPAPYKVIQLLREKIKEFEPILPVLYDLINPDFKANHIGDLSKAIDIFIPENLEITMNDLIAKGILDKRDEISDRSTYATGQKKLNATLEKLKERYKQMRFEYTNFKDTDLAILKDVEPLSEEIDAVLTKIVSMSNSKYAKYLQKDIHFIWNNISKAQEIIDAWLKTQKLLTQLQQIFVYGDLKKQLSDEYPKYQNVEKQWRQIMEQVKSSPQLSEVVQMTKIKESFMKWSSVLEDVNKSLNDYLNMKRDIFPRFYFVSNEELTLMLAQSGDPGLIATNFIQQVFEGMKRLEFTTEEFTFDVFDPEMNENVKKVYNVKKFIKFISDQGEKVDFINIVNPYEEIKGKEETSYRTVFLEKWLNDVEGNMILTLKKLFKECYLNLIDENTKREKWASSHIEQAVLTISQLDWTNRTSKAILDMQKDKNALKTLHKHDTESLLNLIKTIRSQENFTKLFKKTLVSLIIQDVHANDVVDYLIKCNVDSIGAFEWISQLRYFFVNAKNKEISSLDEISNIHVRMLNTERAYDFEYLGNQKRLVITPLTDRCYRTMMEALSNSLGGAPEGPAGTGKTETIKDLSKNLGKKCFTYNCSEDSDYVLMTKFFKGIAMSGCWVCFDEFNRITLDVLSVIAHQISIILTALKAKTTTCTMDGSTFNFNPNMGLFITMNPNYAGRSELPDNLKGLFRPLAMMIPNYEMITEIMLYSFGFNNARDLSKKIVSSLKLASEQLSSQFHYDYGMRALNGIINYIGVISTERKIEGTEEEEFYVQKAIRDSNMPKFIADDYKIYEGILSDLFPKGKFENINDDKLIQSITAKATERNLIANNFLISKIVDFINIMSVRHAVMIVGAPMSNKSSILKVYLDAMPMFYSLNGNENKKVKANIINPKSITGQQLFGYVNKKTMEFYEGICSKTLRDYFADSSDDTKLLAFDGPVDTMWIENMNSVLDDTKKLCLENSDQIRLDERTFVIFEIDDLSQASLATISRCGMVYTDRVNIDPNDFFKSWIKTLPESYQQSNFAELVENLFVYYYDEIVNKTLFDEYNNAKVKMGLPIFKNWFMKIFIDVLESLVFDKISKEEVIENENEKKRMKENNDNENTIEIANEGKDKERDMNNKNISKKDRAELYNKFIHALMISFVWVLENQKDQIALFEKIQEINKNVTQEQNFLMSEEVFEFNKNYGQANADFINYIYDHKDNSFVNAAKLLKDNHDESFKQIRENIQKNQTVMIPSMMSIKATSLIHNAQYNKKPMLIYGSTASGKSLLMMNYINSNSNEFTEKGWLSYTFIFNSKTSANNICDLIEEKISFKLKKGTVAPQGNKNALILIEDLNMPMKERYGAQPPIEILRQYFDYGGWFDRKDKEFLNLKNILIFSNLTLGRPIVSLRLLWHFIPLAFSDIDEITMKDIFKEYFEAQFFDFPNPIRKLRDTVVEGAIMTFKAVKTSFRPLPITPHYNFNLRDLMKIFDGLAMLPGAILANKQDTTDYVMSLLIHETSRVYHDRLCCDKDRNTFISDVLFKLQNFVYHGIVEADARNQFNSIMFSEINGDMLYERVEDIEALRAMIYENMEHYNSNKKAKEKIELILFDYSLKHLLRIDRILARDGEHCVLVGLTGSGRQSLCNVAAFIKKFKIFKTRTKEEVEEYGHKEWLKDIQELYLQAGLRMENTIFMLKDNNITDEQMYVDLNCIISSGVVYNLFTSDEKNETIGNLKQTKEYDEMNLSDDQQLWDAFIAKTMQKCRVFLAMNPLNQNFTKTLRAFPALTNTAIDWYEEWPEDALYYLAKREISKDAKSADKADDLAFIFSKVFTEINKMNETYFSQTRKKVIILPKSFLDFLSFYKHMNLKHSKKIESDILKYKDGVKKIDEAGEQIKLMSELLEKKKPILIEQGKVIEKTLVEISAQSKDAEEAKAQCQENEKIALAKQHDAEYKKAFADQSKQEAELIREEINKKIKLIDKKQFMALRSYRVPPKEITKMMGAIVVIMSNFEKKPLDSVPTQWDYYKKRLNDVKLLKTLEGLPKKLETTQFSEKILTLLKPFVSDPDLEPSYMDKKISSTCACFCHFIISMYKLDDLLKTKLIPLSKASEEASASFNIAQENLNKIRANFQEIQTKLEKLTENYNKINLEQEQLQTQIQESQKKLTRAQKLTSKLSGEQKRWAESASVLEDKKQFLFGDIILSSIYISFLGPFLVPYREKFVTDVIFKLISEKKIKFSECSSINKIIGDQYQISDWVINGLPPDPGSVDNGVILYENTKPCLLIDPQKQALKFLNKMYKSDFLIYKKPEHEKITKLEDNKEGIIESSVRNGKVLIFDYISYDIPLDAEILLSAEEVIIKGEKVLKLNESNEVPLNPKFKYYLISYLSNPIFNPELYGRISIINFTVNKQGLDEQLLSVIVKEESPADESEKNNILQKKYQLNETIHKTEEDILQKLSVSSEALLESDGLIFSLEESKKLSDEATVQIANAKITEERIDNNRLLYLPMAKLATLVFFAISELSNLENIYQFSISWYIKEIMISCLKENDYDKAMINAKTPEFITNRIKILSDSLLKTAYTAVCRSLLNKDKMVFSLLILIRKLTEEEEINDKDVSFFLDSGDTSAIKSPIANKKPQFIPSEMVWKKLCLTEEVESLKELCNDIVNNKDNEWKKYFTDTLCDNSNIEKHFDMPGEFCASLKEFHKLMILKIINPESLIQYIKIVIVKYLGNELGQIPLFTIEELFEMSSFNTPLMLIITPGLDPTNDVKKIGEENNKEIVMLSLGQGQSKKALMSIEQCQKRGQWVFLQNLHLVPNFMPNLEQVISSLQNNDREINNGFRLWISCLPENNILPSILVNSLKITVESPSGMKSNLIKLLKPQEKGWQYEHEQMKRIGKEYEFTKLLMCLMHFHSIILERKNYGPIGWNIKYNFNESDFNISKNILKSNLEKYSGAGTPIPFKAIIYLTADCIYGGRVTDDWDRRALYAILDDLYTQDVISAEEYHINHVKEYSIVYNENYEPYSERFGQLPDMEMPEVLGLHHNTLIRKQIDEGNLIIASLDAMQKGNEGNLMSNKLKVLSHIQSIANEKLLREFNIDEIKKKFPLIYEDCMNSILIQEIMRYNNLLSLIFSSLDDCVKAFMGHLPLTDELDEMANEIIQEQTPSSWIRASYPSRKPIRSWINDLANRIKFFNEWIEKGTPTKFWLSAFFFTQSFLTGIKQNYARKNKESIDRLEFDFDFADRDDYDMKKVISREEYYIYGLYIEGAQWNSKTHTIDELQGRNVSCEMPPIILKVKVCDDKTTSNNAKYEYEAPVYKCSTRQGSLSTTGHSTNYIFTVNLPTNVEAKHWVKRGVALLNQLDD